VRALVPTVLLTLTETDFRRLLAATPEASKRVVPLIRFGGFLSRVPLFADLPPGQLLALALALRLRTEEVQPGTIIVHEGDSGDRFYLVREGTLEVARDSGTLGRLGPGEYFGEIALLTHRPRVATVTAVTPAVLLSLGQEDFYAVLSGFLGTFRRLEEFAHRRLYLLRSQATQ
jgi:cAMP-dependent protein kinase regulator